MKTIKLSELKINTIEKNSLVYVYIIKELFPTIQKTKNFFNSFKNNNKTTDFFNFNYSDEELSKIQKLVNNFKQKKELIDFQNMLIQLNIDNFNENFETPLTFEECFNLVNKLNKNKFFNIEKLSASEFTKAYGLKAFKGNYISIMEFDKYLPTFVIFENRDGIQYCNEYIKYDNFFILKSKNELIKLINNRNNQIYNLKNKIIDSNYLNSIMDIIKI